MYSLNAGERPEDQGCNTVGAGAANVVVRRVSSGHFVGARDFEQGRSWCQLALSSQKAHANGATYSGGAARNTTEAIKMEVADALIFELWRKCKERRVLYGS